MHLLDAQTISRESSGGITPRELQVSQSVTPIIFEKLDPEGESKEQAGVSKEQGEESKEETQEHAGEAKEQTS